MGLSSFLIATAVYYILFSSQASLAVADPRRWQVRSYELDSVAPAIEDKPQIFFEVSKPVYPPDSTPCTAVLFQHSFGNTINSPPQILQYKPLEKCGFPWEKVILRWSAVCKGRQFDRISAVWLSGVEIFRTCTAEPTKRGIKWQVEKDITPYSALLKHPQKLVVALGNVDDSTYTGIYNVTLVADFYKASEQQKQNYADIILPISRPTPENGGYWFQLQNESDVQSVSVKIPKNIYKASLEVCVSFHGSDEFWYSNPTNDYLQKNKLVEPGNGPFREVVVSVDGKVAGAICPFPVVYTGGVNPLFWKPAAAIGAFDLPTYSLDLTPFLGNLVDGKSHIFSMTVTNALDVWLLDANLYLWVDPNRATTRGVLTEHKALPAQVKTRSDFSGSDGTISTEVVRSVSYNGYLESSYGNLTSSFLSGYSYSNLLQFSKNGSENVVKQDIESKSKSMVIAEHQDVSLHQTTSSYPFYMYSGTADGPNSSTVLQATISHGFKQEIESLNAAAILPESQYGTSFFSSLDNKQTSDGNIVIKNDTVISEYGALRQNYSYDSSHDCYSRSLSTRNYTIFFDTTTNTCSHVSLL